MEINIPKILEQCIGLDYVILRNTYDFNDYPIGGDIDILTRDVSGFVTAIMKELNNYAINGYTIHKTIPDSHTHIDILKDKTLLIRFDLIDSLTLDTNTLITYLLANKKEKNKIMFPDAAGDMFTRLLEYFNNTAKVKHLDFVKSKYT